jgi:hypothetical protein
VFDFSGEIMKANHHTFISIILAIFLSFFTSFNELGLNVFSDNMYTESFKQDSCIELQYALILENDNKFENDTPDYDWSTCFCLATNHLHEIEIYFLSKKYGSVKQILFSGKSSRSPPLI